MHHLVHKIQMVLPVHVMKTNWDVEVHLGAVALMLLGDEQHIPTGK
jgi:hypothetical protein